MHMSFIMSVICPVCLHVSAQLSLDRFSWNFILGISMKFCPRTPNLVKTEYMALYMENQLHLYCWQQYKLFCTLTTVQRKPILAFPWHNIQWFYTGCLQMNGAVSKVNKKFFSHLTRAKLTPSAAATVQVSYVLITILQRFARVRWEINFLLTFETAPFFCKHPVQTELSRTTHRYPIRDY